MTLAPPDPLPSPTPIQVLTDTGPPWWGVPVLAGGFLVLGAILGFVFNSINDSRRARREDQNRWRDEVYRLGSEALELCIDLRDEVYGALHQLESGDRDTSPEEMQRISDAIPEMITSFMTLAKQLARLRGLLILIGSKEISNDIATVTDVGAEVTDMKNLERMRLHLARFEIAVENLAASLRHYLGIDETRSERIPLPTLSNTPGADSSFSNS
jgi:hypothetical protein